MTLTYNECNLLEKVYQTTCTQFKYLCVATVGGVALYVTWKMHQAHLRSLARHQDADIAAKLRSDEIDARREEARIRAELCKVALEKQYEVVVKAVDKGGDAQSLAAASAQMLSAVLMPTAQPKQGKFMIENGNTDPVSVRDVWDDELHYKLVTITCPGVRREDISFEEQLPSGLKVFIRSRHMHLHRLLDFGQECIGADRFEFLGEQTSLEAGVLTLRMRKVCQVRTFAVPPPRDGPPTVGPTFQPGAASVTTEASQWLHA